MTGFDIGEAFQRARLVGETELPSAAPKSGGAQSDFGDALAEAVREVGLRYETEPAPVGRPQPAPEHGGLVEVARRGHLTVLAEPPAGSGPGTDH